jgi:hypothetical protein
MIFKKVALYSRNQIKLTNTRPLCGQLAKLMNVKSRRCKYLPLHYQELIWITQRAYRYLLRTRSDETRPAGRKEMFDCGRRRQFAVSAPWWLSLLILTSPLGQGVIGVARKGRNQLIASAENKLVRQKRYIHGNWQPTRTTRNKSTQLNTS